jgi:hypothetical protein
MAFPNDKHESGLIVCENCLVAQFGLRRIEFILEIANFDKRKGMILEGKLAVIEMMGSSRDYAIQSHMV